MQEYRSAKKSRPNLTITQLFSFFH